MGDPSPVLRPVLKRCNSNVMGVGILSTATEAAAARSGGGQDRGYRCHGALHFPEVPHARDTLAFGDAAQVASKSPRLTDEPANITIKD
jgi:hypothetical protein